MTQEALKLAIQLRDTASGYWTENEIPIIEKLIELLAQTQKPVGRFTGKFTFDAHERMLCEVVCTDAIPTAGAALYTTASPQRTRERPWVSLTDEEIDDLWESTASYYNTHDFARAIEAKLKERNG